MVDIVIRGFRDKKTQQFFAGERVREFFSFRNVAERKLTMLDNAADLKDLVSPAGNRLERLKGDRLGQHSIRINDQWRICFVWMADGPHDVEITDYH
jgi:proteic killer suppression protein